MTQLTLAEKRILVVEDEFFLAEDLRRGLLGMGAVVIGPVPSVAQALELIEAGPALDGAVLDVNLGGEMAYPVADALLARSVPFVFASGYDDAALERRYPRVPRCQKPAESRAVARLVARTLGG